MAVDMFLKIEGIPGESTAEKHKGEIEVLSFSLGASNPAGAAGGAAGGGAGKVQISAFHFTARSSKASPLLFQACASGKHFKEAVLSLRHSGGDPGQAFMLWRLSEVLVSDYRIGGEAAGLGPVDVIELSFERVEVEYQAFDPAGRPGETVKAGWDLKLSSSN